MSKKELKPIQVEKVVCVVCRTPKGPLRKVQGKYYCESCIKDIVKCYS